MPDPRAPGQPAPQDVDRTAVRQAMAALAERARTLAPGHGTVLVRGDLRGDVTGIMAHLGGVPEGSFLDPSPLLELLPALRAALPATPALCLEAHVEPEGWHLTACWSPHLRLGAAGFSRALRPLTEPALPGTVPELPVDRAALAARWDQVRHLHRAGAPATPEAIAAAEHALGLPLPAPLGALLELSDGAPFDLEAFETHGDLAPHGLPGGVLGWAQPLSAAQVVAAWREDRTTAADPLAEQPEVPVNPPGVLARTPWHPARVPFARDQSGNTLALDLAPGPAGRPGQVVCYGPSLPRGPVVLAWSLDDYVAGRLADVPPVPERSWFTVEQLAAGQVDPQALDLGVVGDEVATHHLAACPQLSHLEIRARRVDLGGLLGVPLDSLLLTEYHELDLAPLAGHPTLRRLELRTGTGEGRVRGVTALAQLPSLSHLALPDQVWQQAGPLLREHPTLARADFPEAALAPGELRFGRFLELAAPLDAPGDVLLDHVLTLREP